MSGQPDESKAAYRHGCVLGIDLGGTAIKAGLLDHTRNVGDGPAE